MKMYHVTTQKKAKLYANTGYIKAPIRGFDTLLGATVWAMKVGRRVIYSFECDDNRTWKLPDHHNKYGVAWWTEKGVSYNKIKCEIGGVPFAKKSKVIDDDYQYTIDNNFLKRHNIRGL